LRPVWPPANPDLSTTEYIDALEEAIKATTGDFFSRVKVDKLLKWVNQNDLNAEEIQRLLEMLNADIAIASTTPKKRALYKLTRISRAMARPPPRFPRPIIVENINELEQALDSSTSPNGYLTFKRIDKIYQWIFSDFITTVDLYRVKRVLAKEIDRSYSRTVERLVEEIDRVLSYGKILPGDRAAEISLIRESKRKRLATKELQEARDKAVRLIEQEEITRMQLMLAANDELRQTLEANEAEYRASEIIHQRLKRQ
jgi:hypothetical protein